MTATAPIDERVYAAEISPTAAVSSTDGEFVVEVYVPGFHAEELQVEIVDCSLRVEGHAPRRADVARPDFEFSFAIPPRADEGTVGAFFEDGVLTIRTPLGPRQGLRKIEISTSRPSPGRRA